MGVWDIIGNCAKVVAICWIARTAADDLIRANINEIWNNQTDIELTGEENEEEEIEKRTQALEDNKDYKNLKNGLNILYNITGDKQENYDSKVPLLGPIVEFVAKDWWDPVKDETKTSPKKETIPTSWEEKQDDILSIYEGKIEKLNYEVKYKQHMLAVRDIRRIVRANSLSVANQGDMFSKEGDTDDKDIRIVYTYDYTNYYANDRDKIDTSSSAKMEKTDKGIKLTKTITVYQDSFKAVPSPNVDSEIDKVQFGFIFEEDPSRTEEEFNQTARKATYYRDPSKRSESYEHAKTHNSSKNAVSYFQSEKYFNEHKDMFINSENTMIKANNKDAVQTAFALWCYDIYNESNDTISEELKEIDGDLPVTTEIIVRVGNCNYEDKNEETTYEEVKLSTIDWPENVQDIKKVRDKLPSVGGEKKKNDSEIISESELKKKKQEVISGDADLPKINDGEISAEEERNYTIYDWKSIEEDLEEEKEKEKEKEKEQEEAEGEEVGLDTNNKRQLCLSKQNDMKYTASKGIQYFRPEDFEEQDICYAEEDIDYLEI